MKNEKKSFAALKLLGLALAVSTLLGVGSCPSQPNPIIFVHGGSGSGAQFESQAMRFASNGYPPGYLAVVEYNSAAISTILPDVLDAIDAKIAELQTTTGCEKVDLMGHSLGTTVSHAYLATPERAENVAHYVNIDGRSADTPPGDVPTLALWAGAIDRDPPPEIVGALNVTVPDQEHIEVATSEESFYHMYHFLRGHPPLTTKILPQIRSTISGRVVSFPDNAGLDGATLDIWMVDGSTGERVGSAPQATYAIGPDGNFGPFKAWYGLSYEFAVQREGNKGLNYYFEPFIRSSHLVRVNAALILDPLIESSDAHTAVTVIRYKEFWGDHDPEENDVLAIGGTDVITPATAPSGQVGVASSAMFVYDVGKDGVSTLAPPPWTQSPFAGFLTGADLFIPTDPPGTVAVETVPRGDVGAARTVNVPNTPSSEVRIVVQLRDFEQ